MWGAYTASAALAGKLTLIGNTVINLSLFSSLFVQCRRLHARLHELPGDAGAERQRVLAAAHQAPLHLPRRRHLLSLRRPDLHPQDGLLDIRRTAGRRHEQVLSTVLSRDVVSAFSHDIALVFIDSHIINKGIYYETKKATVVPC